MTPVEEEAALTSRFRGHDTRDWSEWNAFATRDALRPDLVCPWFRAEMWR